MIYAANTDTELGDVPGLLFLLTLVLGSVSSVLHYEKAKRYNGTIYEEEIRRWNDSFICDRCTTVFLDGQPDVFVPRIEIGRRGAEVSSSSERTAFSLSRPDNAISTLYEEQRSIDTKFLRCCYTCGMPYGVATFEYQTICDQLQDIYQHGPSDTPPDPNPFAWWWYQYHGLLPPPLDWPQGKVYGLGPEFLKRAAELGTAYWSSNHNHAWQLRSGRAPSWYIASAGNRRNVETKPPARPSVQARLRKKEQLGYLESRSQSLAMEALAQLSRTRHQLLSDEDSDHPGAVAEIQLIDLGINETTSSGKWEQLRGHFSPNRCCA